MLQYFGKKRYISNAKNKTERESGVFALQLNRHYCTYITVQFWINTEKKQMHKNIKVRQFNLNC